MTAKVFLLGIDALDPDYLETYRGSLPVLSALLSKGSSGRLRSTIPPVTAPAWTTAFSGMNPAKTGIAAFTPTDFGSTETVLDSRDVKVPRVWNVLSAQEKRCAVIGVPMAYPVEEINGMMVGGFMTPSIDVPFTYPTGLQDKLVGEGYIPSLGLKGDTRDRSRFLNELYNSSRVKYDAILEYLEGDEWDCFIAVLSESDWIQHYLARPVGHPDYAVNQGELLRFFQYIDKYLGRWLEAAGPEAHVLVCSDHGFGHFIHHNVHVNRYLIDTGYLSLKKRPASFIRDSLVSRMRDLSLLPGWRFIRPKIPRKAKRAALGLAGNIDDDVDWALTTAVFKHKFWFTGAVELNQGLFSDEESFNSERQELCSNLRQLKDPLHDRLVFREVYLREEIFHGPYADREPDIICLFNEGYGGVDLPGPRLVIDVPFAGISGGLHRQDGVWILSGPDIRPGKQAALDLQDVAPIIYHLMAVPAPDDMDGQVPKAIFTGGTKLANHHFNTRDFSGIERVFVLSDEIDEKDANQLVIERLQYLGYIN